MSVATLPTQAHTDTSCFLFTLEFPENRFALLEVRGVSTPEEAQKIAQSCFVDCYYEILNNNAKKGQAAYHYVWCPKVPLGHP